MAQDHFRPYPARFCILAGFVFSLWWAAAPSTRSQEPPDSTNTFTIVATSTTQFTPPELTLTEASGTPVVSQTPERTSTTQPSETLTTSGPQPSPTSTLSPPTTTVPMGAPNPTSYPAGVLLINEVAWAGTLASANDEWIELHNTSSIPVDLTGWHLRDGGDISVSLQGLLPAYSYFLLERTDDSTISNLSADQIYTGALKNNGETLELTDPEGNLIDSANAEGGSWPAGDPASHASMERRGGEDLPGNWGTSTALGYGLDAQGNLILGTPRSLNSFYIEPTPTEGPTEGPTSTPTPTPTPTLPLETSVPGCLRINEVAWAGTHASANDEWIELYNPGDAVLDLEGWVLTDEGDILVKLEGLIPGRHFFLLERTDDGTISDIPAHQIYRGSLRNSGESLFLYDPWGQLIDSAN